MNKLPGAENSEEDPVLNPVHLTCVCDSSAFCVMCTDFQPFSVVIAIMEVNNKNQDGQVCNGNADWPGRLFSSLQARSIKFADLVLDHIVLYQ